MEGNSIVLIQGIIFIILGIIILIQGYKRLKTNFEIKNNGLTTTGKIVDIIEENDDGINYFPVITFRTLNGQIIKEKLMGRTHTKFEIGQEVEIYYKSEEPYLFSVKSDSYGNYAPYFFILGGLTFLGVGIYKYYLFIK